MNIIFSVNNGEEVKILPIVPNDIEITQEQKNEEFETINNGNINLIGDMGLRALTISSILFNKEYSWMKNGSTSDAMSYIEFFKKWWGKRVPFRLIILDEDENEYLNMPCTINNLNYSKMKNGDISYSLEIKEYKFVNINI